eukprot:227136_1
MGNVVDKTVRGLSPVTWAAAAFDAKESYYCPVCGREVWAYGHMVGTKCKGCPGRRATAQTIVQYRVKAVLLIHIKLHILPWKMNKKSKVKVQTRNAKNLFLK